MDHPRLETTARELFLIFRLFHKHVLNIDECLVNSEMSRSHYEVLFLLDDLGMQTMTEIARKLFLSKPYMTSLIDKLMGEGLVERLPDKKDRRIINILLTEKGRQYLKEHRVALEAIIEKKILHLTEDELEQLSHLTANLVPLVSKLKTEKDD